MNRFEAIDIPLSDIEEIVVNIKSLKFEEKFESRAYEGFYHVKVPNCMGSYYMVVVNPPLIKLMEVDVSRTQVHWNPFNRTFYSIEKLRRYLISCHNRFEKKMSKWERKQNKRIESEVRAWVKITGR